MLRRLSELFRADRILIDGLGPVMALAVSPADAGVFAVAGEDITPRIYRPDGTVISLDLTEGFAAGFAFSGDGTVLATGAWDHTVRLWNVKTGEMLSSVRGHLAAVGAVAMSSDGLTVVSGADDDTVCVWGVPDLTMIEKRAVHTDFVRAVAVARTGRRIVSAGLDGVALAWTPGTDSDVVFEGHAGGILTVALSPDDRILATGSFDRTVRLWDSNSGERVATLAGHEGWVEAVVFSRDGRHVVSAGEDSVIRIWEPGRTASIKELRGHTAPVTALAVAGKRLFSASRDGSVRAWRLP